MSEETQEKSSGSLEKAYDRKTDFPGLISQIEAGSISNVLGLAMSNVALAVANSGKQGEVSLKIKLKPASQTDPSILNTVVSMAVNEPKPKFGSKKEDFKYDTVAYCGYGGKVTYERPKEDVRSQLGLIPEGMAHLKVGGNY
ncbi:hypothetical protein [Vibrio sp. ER1A]|uniref:hypothetical protein n=1 Tax=Vibrio sp. ER1A TaxID=1517681 RepID=UPI0004DD4F4C|nr:hypothetical protein [Vibrio sp. ER1A]KFA99445.1 hypothetical protein HW45_03525 [Vibrio sp. ER1A]